MVQRYTPPTTVAQSSQSSTSGPPTAPRTNTWNQWTAASTKQSAHTAIDASVRERLTGPVLPPWAAKNIRPASTQGQIANRSMFLDQWTSSKGSPHAMAPRRPILEAWTSRSLEAVSGSGSTSMGPVRSRG